MFGADIERSTSGRMSENHQKPEQAGLFQASIKEALRTISSSFKLKSKADGVSDQIARQKSFHVLHNLSPDGTPAQVEGAVDEMLEKNQEYVIISGRSYHWAALVGQKTVFKLNDISRHRLLRRVLRKAAQQDDSGDRVYKWAMVVRRMSYAADSEKVLWSSTCKSDETSNGKQEILKKYVNFCFPENVDGHYSELLDETDTYQFTCVTTDGWIEYIYCLRRVDFRMLPTVFCIASNRIAYHFYDSVLREVASRFQMDEEDGYGLLQTLLYKPIPREGMPITFPLSHSNVFLYCWPAYEDRWVENTGLLCQQVSVKILIDLFNAVLRSCSVICSSRHMSKLSRCVHAVSMLMYPFMWPYQLVTLIPTVWALDFLDVPSPHLYGCLSSLAAIIKSKPLRDTLFVDIDSNSSTYYDSEGKAHQKHLFSLSSSDSDLSNEGGLPDLPPVLLDHLSTRLHYLKRFRFIEYSEVVVSIIASEVFLGFFVYLLGHLPDILDEMVAAQAGGDKKESVILKPEEVRSRLLSRALYNSQCREFLSLFTSSMMFTSFIESGRWKDERSAKFFRRVKEMRDQRQRCRILTDDTGIGDDSSFVEFKELCSNVEHFVRVFEFK